ncbi:MAG: adenosylcobinamide-GDP ribazoletransferase [Actinobacteria bacterium]|nr:adenosylcobinamide-GDP ribazoletransferase [Actinomycetota bacterium]
MSPGDPYRHHRLGGARAAVAFLTPLGGAFEPEGSALLWFPAVGLAIGLTLGGLWWALERIWPVPVAAAIVVAADLGLTGMLHFDGLADSADGLLSHLDPASRLVAMAEPGVGAYGLAAGGLVILLRWVALDSILPAPLLLAGLWCTSRSLMAVVPGVIPHARKDGGLAASFLRPFRPPRWQFATIALLGGAAGVAAGLSWRILPGLISVLGAALAGTAVVWLGYRRLGGYTGDVLGAAGVLAETVGLLIAAVRWPG